MQKTNPVITNLFNPPPPKTGSMPCSTKNKKVVEEENPYSDVIQLPESKFNTAKTTTDFKSPNNTTGVFSG